MTTKNHKPATTSDILPGTLSSGAPLTKEDPHSAPFAPKTSLTNSTRARCGKVARLPKEIRDQINQMLLDGIPHAQIIQKLKQTFGSSNAETPADTKSNVLPLDPADAVSKPDASDSGHESRITNHESSSNPASSIEHPVSPVSSSIQHPESLSCLTPHHLTTWKKFGGYRDWLKDQQRIADCKLRHELTLDLARSAEGVASYQAAPKVAVAQICQTIIDLGPEGLKDAMKDSPLNCFRLLNALARLINSGLKCENHIAQHAAEIREKQPGGLSAHAIKEMQTALNMM